MTPRPSQSAEHRIARVVICGGRSSRMGVDKSSLVAGGRTFLRIAVDRLRKVASIDGAVPGPVWINGRSTIRGGADDVFPDDASVAGGGPMGGLMTVLERCQTDGCTGAIVTPVDTPRLAAEHLRMILGAAGRCDPPWAVPVVARSDRTEPLIGYYPATSAGDLRRRLESGDRSLFRWVGSIEHETLALPVGVCRNINTPEQYESIR